MWVKEVKTRMHARTCQHNHNWAVYSGCISSTAHAETMQPIAAITFRHILRATAVAATATNHGNSIGLNAQSKVRIFRQIDQEKFSENLRSKCARDVSIVRPRDMWHDSAHSFILRMQLRILASLVFAARSFYVFYACNWQHHFDLREHEIPVEVTETHLYATLVRSIQFECEINERCTLHLRRHKQTPMRYTPLLFASRSRVAASTTNTF